MKRGYIICIFLILLSITLYVIWYSIPRRINLTYAGIKYQLGNPNKQEFVNIKIDGSYVYGILSKDSFQGSIKIGDENLTGLKLFVGEDYQLLNYFDEREGKFKIFGEIYIGKGFKDLTVCIREDNIKWTSKNGMMISAPSKDRTEALKISNELMRNAMKNIELK